MNRKPTHPGALLKLDVLPALGLSKSAFARGIGLSRSLIHDVLEGRRPVTPSMALRIERFTGVSASLLARMQLAHDLWTREREEADTLAEIELHRVA